MAILVYETAFAANLSNLHIYQHEMELENKRAIQARNRNNHKKKAAGNNDTMHDFNVFNDKALIAIDTYE